MQFGLNTGMLKDVLDRINKRLKVVHLSESKAAREAGLSADAIRNMRRKLEHGDGAAGASIRTLDKLAPVLKTTAAWLLEESGPEEGNARAETIPVPLISWVSAGALLQPDVPVDDDDTSIVIHEPELDPRGDWIALRVEGDSMNRVSPHGSVIFVNRKNRRLAAKGFYVIGDGEGGATYKRYKPPNTWEPYSTNESHKPFVLKAGQEPDIIGRVEKTVLKLLG
jgi:phage repressor protein C with HTH and peptisase S24 domain